jgi:alanine transaminase
LLTHNSLAHDQITPQVAALMEWPALVDLAPNAFPKDVVARAKELQEEIGSIGAYSHSQGVPFIRQNVAKFIEGESSIDPK